jgi:ACGX-repeat protein
MGKLERLDGWANQVSSFFARRNAQSYFGGARLAMAAGSACGAGDGDKKKSEPKPAACGSACGAGDDGKKKSEPKPSACGAGGR